MNNPKPLCKYGAGCYQKNQLHKEKYSHPSPPTRQVVSVESSIDTSNEHQKRRRGRSSTDSSTDSSTITSEAKIPRQSTSPTRPNTDSTNESPPQTSIIEDDAIVNESRFKLLESTAAAAYEDGPSRSNDIDFISGCFDLGERPFSQRSEHRELLKDSAHFIRDKFLVQMPVDFYKFWEFCKQQAVGGAAPDKIADILRPFDLQLVGPFDVLSGGFDDSKMFEPGDYLRHWRFFYDPAEFQVRWPSLIKK